MPPDVQSCVRKFIPNNAPLSRLVTKVLNTVYGVRYLPMDLVRLVVRRAFELERDLEMEIDSSIFEEKITLYAHQLRPRFNSKINQIRRQQVKRWR